jgi:peptidoglycan/xylan/chitin deacetylase (PgdA/CDA1 family)
VSDGGGVTVLAYHWIDPDPGRALRAWGVTPGAFAAQMRALADGGFRVVGLGEVEATARGGNGAPEARTVALTFDDGYRGLLRHALPVLERHGFRATFFLVSDRVGGVNAWDARHGDPPRPLMDWDEAADLAARGMEIGSHSRTHPFLPALGDRELEDEIRGSRETIEDRLGREVRFFSYPHGLYDGRCLRAVAAAGYAAACSSREGANRPGTDRFLLRRAEILCDDGGWSFACKARTGLGVAAWAGARLGTFVRRRLPAVGEASS